MFWDFEPSDSLLIAKKITEKGVKLTDEQIEALGANIAEDTPIDDIIALANAVPISCFDFSNDSALVSLLLSNTKLDDTRMSYIIDSVNYY